MPEITVKNLAKGNQFVHTLKGTKELPAGQDGTAEFSDGEIASMLKNPSLELSQDGKVISNHAPQSAIVKDEVKRPVWGEGKNEAGSDLRPGQTMAPKQLSKKAQKALDEKREEAASLGLELADDLPVEDIQKAIDAKLAE